MQTRDGRKARIICTDFKGLRDSLVAAIWTSDGYEQAQTNHASGRYYIDRESDYDIVNIPEKLHVEWWLNVYKGGEVSRLHTSKQAAVVCAKSTTIARVKISLDVTEGEGLEVAK